MDNGKMESPAAGGTSHDITAESQALFQPGPIHIQPAGEDMFQGGMVGGLHLGPSGDRLPGADPLYDGSLEAKVEHKP